MRLRLKRPAVGALQKKSKASKIDSIVALAMACHAAVEGQAHQPLIVTREHINTLMTWPARRAGLQSGGSWGEQMYGERKWLQMQRAGRRRY